MTHVPLPRVVVIPCRNEAATLPALLDALAGQDQLPDEILVVDDGSTDETARVADDWARAHPHLRVVVIRSARAGAGAAMNRGVAAAAGPVVLRLDGHSVPAVDYVRRSLEALVETGAGVVGGVWEVTAGAATPAAGAIAAAVAHPLGSGGVGYRHPERITGRREVDTVPFGAFSVETWKAVGGYDERLLANQDYDFNYRVRQLGLAVVLDPAIASMYRARPTLGQLVRQYHRYGVFKCLMLKKSPAAVKMRQILPALVIPWVVGTVGAAALAPGPWALALASSYPVALVLGAGDVARRHPGVQVPWALAALAGLHVAWSAGFWRGLVRQIPPLEK